MKTRILTGILIAFALSDVYGQNSNKTIPKETYINIELLYPTQDSVKLTIAPLLKSEFMNEEQVFSFKLINGKFRLKLPIDQISSLNIFLGKNQVPGRDRAGISSGDIWIEPSDNISISIPTPQAEINNTVSITGKGSEKSAFLKTYFEYFSRIISPSIGGKYSIDKYGYFDYEHDIISRDRKIYLAIDSLGSVYQNSVDKNFIELLKTYQLGLIHYGYFGGGHYPLECPNHLEQFHSIEKEFPADKIGTEMAIKSNSAAFIHYVNRALVAYASKNGLKDNYVLRQEYTMLPKIVAEYYQTPRFVNKLISQHFMLEIQLQKMSDSLTFGIKNFLAHSDPNDEYVKDLQAAFNSAITNQRPGSTALPFSLQNENHETVNLSDFKGQVVLLDFMFNGCGGCAQMVPGMEEVEEKYSGKDVVFVSISIDKIFERFKDAIGKYSSKGSLHLYTNGLGATHELIKYYAISGYPNLVLIDKEGKLITARAPRADSQQKELIAMIDDALEK